MNATTSRLCLLLAAALAALASQAHNITGRVTCGGHGIAGVAVSDGITVTTTDAGGYYSMTSGKMNGYVFVTVPRGYEPACRDGFDPQFWQLLNHPDSTVAEVHDFALDYRVSSYNYYAWDIILAYNGGDIRQVFAAYANYRREDTA